MKFKQPLPLLFLLAMALSALQLQAQKPLNKTKQALALVITAGEGTTPGSVAWDPERKRYYASFKGAEGEAVECFDQGGASQGAPHVKADLLGLWFYPETGEVEGNASGESGWFVLALDAKGVPSGPAESVFSGQIQPEEGSKGCYDPVKKCVNFYSKGTIYLYERATGEQHQKVKVSEDVKQGNLLPSAVGCTGKAGYDFALLDREDGKVLLLDRKGQLTGDVALPKGTTGPSTQGFAVANGLAWVYDAATHSWLGFPLFE
jgi:hypothetical protein